MDSRTVQKDIAIIGGGVIGSAIAYFIQKMAPGSSVCVIEPDPTYEFASSLRQLGGCRVQFTRPENIEMSKFSIDFFREFDVGWEDGGYLFIVPPGSTRLLERNVNLQTSMGCEVELLTPQELKRCFPSMNVTDLGCAAHTPRDGWCDPRRALQGFRRAAEAAGTEYVHARVAALEGTDTAIQVARLSNGTTVRAKDFVNAAGPWAAEVAAMAGMLLPVLPMKRLEHAFTAGEPMETLPYVKDVGAMAVRSSGPGYAGGLVDWSASRGIVDYAIDETYFERVVRPAAGHRFPPMAKATCQNTWSGLYEVCSFDKNAIIGRWNLGKANLVTAAGFSGHGFMHAPAAGRAVAELLVKGRFESIDLTAFAYERIANNQPAAETGIV